jgi:acetyl esterase/lipase
VEVAVEVARSTGDGAADEPRAQQHARTPDGERHEAQHGHHDLEQPPAGRTRARILPRHALLLPALLALGACSGAALINALTPRDGYHVERDIAYGPDPRQRLALYVPDAAPPDAPLLVFFYGGRWEAGSRDLYPFVGQAFASRGYLVAIPDYRLYPQVRYPAFLEDGASAVAALADRTGAGRGGRPLFLAGHSAGAYIAAMLALDQRWLDRAGGGPRPCVDAALGLAGPYDFLPLDDPVVIEVFGPGPAEPSTQPVSHVDPGDPPMLLATGAGDTTVRPRNTQSLAARLRAAGVRAETRLYDRPGHIALVAALAAPLHRLAPILDDADAFLRGVAAASRRTCG